MVYKATSSPYFQTEDFVYFEMVESLGVATWRHEQATVNMVVQIKKETPSLNLNASCAADHDCHYCWRHTVHQYMLSCMLAREAQGCMFPVKYC